jgi:hypothetical protein
VNVVGGERAGSSVHEDQDPVLQPGAPAGGDQAVLHQGEDTRQCAPLIQVPQLPVGTRLNGTDDSPRRAALVCDWYTLLKHVSSSEERGEYSTVLSIA